MIYSMTGYGKSVATWEDKKICVEVRSLNGKAMDLSARIAPQYKSREMEVRTLVSNTLERGKVDLAIWVEQNEKVELPSINVAVMQAYVSQMQAASEQTGVAVPENLFEVSVTICNDEYIHELNKEYRGKDKATDVLSFPILEFDTPEVMTLLGDIIISVDTASKQAEEYGNTLERELCFLAVHSSLHLLGYDHENGGLEAVKMREKEEAVLTRVGLKRNGSYYFDEE